jgi:hypothetical protein
MLGSKKIAPLQVSKWIKIPLLVDVHEMEDLLLRHTPSFKIYDVHRINKNTEGICDPSVFLEGYSRYIACLKRGEVPSSVEFRPLFSSAWSVTEEAFFSMPVEDNRRLLKASAPVVQTQWNQIRYAPEEKIFRTQVFGSDTISWGLQIGFPHLFLNPENFEAEETHTFPNRALFVAIQRWIRYHTTPTPFIVEGVKTNSPIRLGQACFGWIASHPHLQNSNIKIART